MNPIITTPERVLSNLQRKHGTAVAALAKYLSNPSMEVVLTFPSLRGADHCRTSIYALRKELQFLLSQSPDMIALIPWANIPSLDEALARLAISRPARDTLILSKAFHAAARGVTISQSAPGTYNNLSRFAKDPVPASSPRKTNDKEWEGLPEKSTPKNEPIDDNQLAIEELQWQISKLEREHRNLALYVDRPDPLGLIPESDKTRFFDLQNELTNLRASLAALQEEPQQ